MCPWVLFTTFSASLRLRTYPWGDWGKFEIKQICEYFVSNWIYLWPSLLITSHMPNSTTSDDGTLRECHSYNSLSFQKVEVRCGTLDVLINPLFVIMSNRATHLKRQINELSYTFRFKNVIIGWIELFFPASGRVDMDRLESLNASPSATPWTYLRAYSALLFIFLVDVIWFCLLFLNTMLLFT